MTVDGPSISSPLSDVLTRAGESLTVNCLSIGRPQPIAIWYKDESTNRLLSGSSYILHSNGSITFTRLTANMGGVYKCVTTNTVNTATKSFQLTVLSEYFLYLTY